MASTLDSDSPLSVPPWTARIKHHPIFQSSASASASASATDIDQTTVLPSASASFSRFANVSISASVLDASLLDPELDLDLDLDVPVPRNVLAASGQILAVIVSGQLRLVSLRAVKTVCAALPASASEQDIVSALHEHAPYWRVHLPSSSLSPSTESTVLASSWLQLQFNQTGRFLALLSAHRLAVIDFGSSLTRLADASIPTQQPSQYNSSTFSLTASLGTLPNTTTTNVNANTTATTTATLGYLDPSDLTPTLNATLYELGASSLLFASTTSPLIQCLWHPMSKDHSDLLVLAQNGHLSVYSILASINEPVHTYYALDEQSARDRINPMMADVHAACTPVGMAFGVVSRVFGQVDGVHYKSLAPERVWSKCTVYVAMRDGSVKAICPVLPRVWNMSLFDYKCMHASLLTLPDSSAASPLAATALARFLTHINTQLDPEYQIRPPTALVGTLRSGGAALRFSESVVRDADLPDAADLVFAPSDLTSHVFVDAPVYDGIVPYAQAIVLDADSLPTAASLDLAAVCTDVCVALAEATEPEMDVQVPVMLVAWYAGEVDVVCTDTVWPMWGTRVSERARRMGGEPLTWVVRKDDEGGAAGNVSAFATETIRLDVASGFVRLAMDPVVAGQIVVTHAEGVHQVVVRLGAASIAHQVVDTVPLKGLLQHNADEQGNVTSASMISGGAENLFKLNASTILGGHQSTKPQVLRNPVVGCVAIGDALLGHSTIFITPEDASAAPLYTIDLALVDLAENYDDIDPATLPASSRAVLDLAAPFKNPLTPYPFVSLADIPDTLPIVSRLNLPESRAEGVSEPQLEYLFAKTAHIGKLMQPLSTLVDQMKDAMHVMSTLEEQARSLIKSLAFSKLSVKAKLEAAELAAVQVEQRADGMLQVIHDVRHPAHLTPAERKYHREVVKAAHEANALRERVGKVAGMRDRFVEWADEERRLREEARAKEADIFGGPVSPEMVDKLMGMLQAQYLAIRRMEEELERVRASDELAKRLERLEV
ncbi:hypothetical protein BCR44DRAFT_1511799 [Catenaria anguillulae PL171]|uniref:Uncharacterized protein n=1 Tax=Catenaria anguillulae PL171 TaxID=765915 RepID=A0A1Y2HTT2_9FUNG|nr:hypothetical protein BCR44DRAFT_1511799 [Catenaria anguillulae PL171]